MTDLNPSFLSSEGNSSSSRLLSTLYCWKQQASTQSGSCSMAPSPWLDAPQGEAYEGDRFSPRIGRASSRHRSKTKFMRRISDNGKNVHVLASSEHSMQEGRREFWVCSFHQVRGRQTWIPPFICSGWIVDKATNERDSYSGLIRYLSLGTRRYSVNAHRRRR